MDLRDSPAEAQFRQRAQRWLKENAVLRKSSVDEALAFLATEVDKDQYIADCKAWQRHLCAHGYAGLTWPIEYGGQGLGDIEGFIFNQEKAKYGIRDAIFFVGFAIAGPTILRHGTKEQKLRYLPAMLNGEEVWCQLFSEPDAGSDLASLKTAAVRDGSGWRINGQKVWTSQADIAQNGILLARTNPEAPKHKGISCFVLDMAAPGIEVRPLRQATGVAHFSEVFFDDVYVPDSCRVGEIDAGWNVAMSTLASERTNMGFLVPAAHPADVAALLVRPSDSGRDGVDSVVQLFIDRKIIELLGLRIQTAISKDLPIGVEPSLLKVKTSRHVAHSGEVTMRLLGGQAMLNHDDAPDQGVWHQYFLAQWSSRIGGGTEQVQLNLLAEHYLGLPKA